MADEITLNGKMKVVNSTTNEIAEVRDLLINQTAKGVTHLTQTIGSTEEAIDLGQLSTLGYALFINRGPTDTISLRQATSASDFCDLKPTEFALFRVSADMTAPFAISSSTNSPVLEFWILED